MIYSFHADHGPSAPTREELVDDHSAKRAAIAMCASVLDQNAAAVFENDGLALRVRDPTGREVIRLTVRLG